MLKRTLRLLRRLDDLAEVILLHVLLGPTGRRVLMVALVIGLAAAAGPFSGLWMIGTKSLPDSSQPFAEPLASAWDPVHEELVGEIADSGVFHLDQMDKVARAVQANAESLDRAALLCSVPGSFSFARTPNYRTVRRLANLLVARAAVEFESDQAAGAVKDLLAACGVAEAVARGSRAEPPLLIDQMIGVAVQRRAVKVLAAHALELPARLRAAIVARLTPRATTGHQLAAVLRNESRFTCRVLQTYAAEGSLPDMSSAPELKLFLPWREAARREAAKALQIRVTRAFELPARELESLHGSLIGAADFDRKDSEAPGQLEAAKGCVLGSAGIEVAGRLLLAELEPSLPKVLARLDTRDREVAALLAQCSRPVSDLEEPDFDEAEAALN